MCCASPGTKRRGGDCGQGSGQAQEAFPPAPKSRAVSTRHSTLTPPTIRGRERSLARWVPYVCVPRRALGNVPGAMPPHLPQHELMCLASPGFTLALPSPAAAFRSHPEGRSLAVLRRRPRPGFVCNLHLVPLCTSWKCEGGCHCSRLRGLLPTALATSSAGSSPVKPRAHPQQAGARPGTLGYAPRSRTSPAGWFFECPRT